MKYLFLVLLASISLNINAQQSSIKTIGVAPNLSFQNYEHFKRLVVESPDSEAEFIEGFQFDWGYNYLLKVQEVKYDYLLSDGTSGVYVLEEILSKTKVADSTTFFLYLDSDRYYYQLPAHEAHMNNTLEELNDSTYLYFESVEVIVPKKFKSKFTSIIEEKKSKRGKFIFLDDHKIKLIEL